MTDIKSKLTELYSLEQLSMKTTIIHRLNTFSKLIATVVYIICIISVGKYHFQTLTFYFFYPIIIMSLSEIPFSMIMKRASVALPFCLFAGISNIIFDNTVLFSIGSFYFTGGFCSFITIIIKSFLSVSAILILIATTPFQKLTSQFKRMRIPNTAIMLIEMIYRYIGVLMNQADTMIIAYRLRSPDAKFPDIKHMGSFIGQLFLHSFDRAERVYNAMKCRGYGLSNINNIQKEKFKLSDFIFIAFSVTTSIVFLII